jgi:uncharacterized protein involved in exopolysaccharide biosynthesis
MSSASTIPEKTPPYQLTGEAFFLQLLRACWRKRVFAILFSLLCASAAGVAAWLLPKQYEATLLMSPVVSQNNGGGLASLGSAVSQLGGLASLAGISMSGSGGTKAESLATLESEIVTQQYIHDHDLLKVLFPRKWDAQLLKWKSSDLERIPTLWKGNLLFNEKVRTVKETPKTGLVTMTIKWSDPAVAAEWANGLVRLTNEYLRDKAIKESDRNISFLTEQANKTTDVVLRSSIYSLMQSEIRKQMLARGSDEYALKVIDPATPPEKAASPLPLLWILAAFSVGLLLVFMFVFLQFLFTPDTANE